MIDPGNDTTGFHSSRGGVDKLVGSLSGGFQSLGGDPLYANQVSCLKMVGRFRGGRWQDSHSCLVNGWVSIQQSLQRLEKGTIRHFCLGDISEHAGEGGNGRCSSKHSSQEQATWIRNIEARSGAKGRRLTQFSLVSRTNLARVSLRVYPSFSQDLSSVPIHTI